MRIGHHVWAKYWNDDHESYCTPAEERAARFLRLIRTLRNMSPEHPDRPGLARLVSAAKQAVDHFREQDAQAPLTIRGRGYTVLRVTLDGKMECYVPSVVVHAHIESENWTEVQEGRGETPMNTDSEAKRIWDETEPSVRPLLCRTVTASWQVPWFFLPWDRLTYDAQDRLRDGLADRKEPL